jgi:hypothetical protein
MKKNNVKMILGIGFAVIALFYAGAMFNFFPFIGDDLIVREIGFCTLIICLTIAVCTCIILDKK